VKCIYQKEIKISVYCDMKKCFSYKFKLFKMHYMLTLFFLINIPNNIRTHVKKEKIRRDKIREVHFAESIPIYS